MPLPVAGAKLQNLPPQLTVYAHMLVLHKLMAEPPHHAAALNVDGRAATNIVIGPMLAQRDFLGLQQVQMRVVTISGGKPTELGQAVFSLRDAALGRPTDFDVMVERNTIPAGFNLRGTVSIVYTKMVGDDVWGPASARGSARLGRNSGGRRPEKHALGLSGWSNGLAPALGCAGRARTSGARLAHPTGASKEVPSDGLGSASSTAV